MVDYTRDIERYLRGEMSPEEMHRFEKAALSDPFLADALEGASLANSSEFSTDVRELQEKFTRREKIAWGSPMRIAASVLILLAGTWLIYWSNSSPENVVPLAQEKSKGSTQPLLAKEEKDSLPLDVAKDPKRDFIALNKTSAADKKAGRVDMEKRAEPSVTLRAAEPPLIGGDADQAAVPAASSSGVPADDDAKADSITLGQQVAASPGRNLSEEEIPREVVDVRKAETKKVAGSRAYKMKLDKAEKIPAPEIYNTPEGPNFTTIRGRVTTTDERKPLAGISVTSKGSNVTTRTDAQGNYSISSDKPVTALVFSSEGVETSEVDAVGDASVNVQLAEPGKAGEIVVSGADASASYDHNDPNLRYASPTVGYRSYNRYLLNSLIYPPEALAKKITGNVQVEFSVKRDSTLTDFKVERSIGHGCDEELIRLIKAGPRWVPLKQADQYFDSKVRVRMKFTLPK